MFALERGDDYALEGRVIVYVENLRPREDDDVFYLVYSATSPIDICLFDEQMVDRGEIERLETKWNQTRKRLIHDATREGLEGFVPFASRIMRASRHEDIFEIPGDVVYAGKALGRKFILRLLESVTNAYMINYSAQVFENMEMSEAPEEVQGDSRDTFEKYDGATLTKTLSDLTSRLYHAIEIGDDEERNETIGAFRQIALHSPFVGEIANIIGIAQTDNPHKNELIDLYIKMIGAIRAEEYRTAAGIRKEIQAKLD